MLTYKLLSISSHLDLSDKVMLHTMLQKNMSRNLATINLLHQAITHLHPTTLLSLNMISPNTSHRNHIQLISQTTLMFQIFSMANLFTHLIMILIMNPTMNLTMNHIMNLTMNLTMIHTNKAHTTLPSNHLKNQFVIT